MPASAGLDPDYTQNVQSESHSGIQDSHMPSGAADNEVVEVEDQDPPQKQASPGGSPAPTPKRPGLPRLNSKSRAPPSSFGCRRKSPSLEKQDVTPSEDDLPEEASGNSSSPSQDRPSQDRPSQDRGSPLNIRQSSEIPIPTRGASHSRPRSNSESCHSYTNSEESTHTPGGSPSLKAKSDSDGQNPTIQIPKVTPLSFGLALPPNLSELAVGLEDKYVDEFGNILDWDGRVLGRVEGDLPSMIGRPISATGEVMTEAGEVVGYVAENEAVPSAPPPPQPIHGMGEGVKVDYMGNILDAGNNVIGHFNSEHLGKDVKIGGGRPRGQAAAADGPHRGPHNCTCGEKGPRPKPTAAPSPSEIYLDVKSTNDGVQLIIKIPTVFNGGGGPNIHISSSEGKTACI